MANKIFFTNKNDLWTRKDYVCIRSFQAEYFTRHKFFPALGIRRKYKTNRFGKREMEFWSFDFSSARSIFRSSNVRMDLLRGHQSLVIFAIVGSSWGKNSFPILSFLSKLFSRWQLEVRRNLLWSGILGKHYCARAGRGLWGHGEGVLWTQMNVEIASLLDRGCIDEFANSLLKMGWNIHWDVDRFKALFEITRIDITGI